MTKKVLFFGIYEPNYSRSRVLAKGFVENGWEVVHCRVDARAIKGIQKYIHLWRQGRALRHQSFDLVIAAYPAQTTAWLARLLFGKNIIFDAFLSFYDSNVCDRKMYSNYSIRGMRDYFIDWLGAWVSEYTLIDTNEHIEYYSKTFHIPKNKFKRVLVGSDDSLFFPLTQTVSSPKKFIIEFHGMFIPLQGVEYIVRAAHELRDDTDIVFNIIGRGQTYAASMKLAEELKLTNVNFINQVPVLKQLIADGDICLGIFGNTEKTLRVIPNKVYECAAMGRPIVTCDSPAIREVFTDKKDIILVETANPQDLADKIRLLKSDDKLRASIAHEARTTFLRKCSPKIIVSTLLEDLHINQ